MTKKAVKKILMSMRNDENAVEVNNLLGKIDLMEEGKIGEIVEQLGGTEKEVKEELARRIMKAMRTRQEKEEANNLLGTIIGGSEQAVDEETTRRAVQTLREEHKYSINEMFTYGVSGDSIHLHLPVNLEHLINKIGVTKTVDTANLYLLDAIEKIAQMKKEGFEKFRERKSIYMISPILRGQELIFLKDLDFKTQTYKKQQLRDSKFLEENPEARLARTIFGADKKVGTAQIDIDRITTPEWQEKKAKKVKEINDKGITIDKIIKEEEHQN